ncbi:MAG: LysR family transcriptional regulator [Lachnospiraceae bacterium]|nr:LysR family transcriptional regulator [Lachnospiraceae bacterium]
MDLKQLQYFKACVQCGSMSKAAEQLYTSQPHVSAVIKSLEQELSVVLFQRQSGGICLTRQGEQVYGYVRNILKDLEQMELSCQKAGRRQLSVMSNYSRRMEAFFSGFYQKYASEEISFTYLEGGLEKILENLISGRVELGFAFLSENRMNVLNALCKKQGLHKEILTISDAVLYVGKKSPFYKRKSVSPEELKSQRYIQLEEDYFGMDDLLLKILPLGEASFRVITTNSSVIQMLLHTELCNIGSYWKKDFFREGNIRLIPVDGYEKKISFLALYRELSPLGREYLENVKEALLQET